MGERKVFFSEEKKQKTFANSGVCAACKVRDSVAKSFGSFLQKRTSSLLLPCHVEIQTRLHAEIGEPSRE